MRNEATPERDADAQRQRAGRLSAVLRAAIAGAVLLWIATRSLHALAAPLPVEIRRTTDGIPHIKAADWRGLGYGIGYAQGQDALCTLAEAFTTYEGRRSFHFGPENRPARESSFGRPLNLELDFFFKAFADDAMVARYRAAQPPGLNDAVEGFAAGYNRQLQEARAGHASGSQRLCLHEAWVHEIGPDDLYRRFYAAQVAAGYARFIPEIVNAQPGGASPAAQVGAASLSTRLAHRVGDQDGLGSNMMAFGRQATGEGGSVLLGNPHWYWGGPDRFYQMQLTIPGQVNVAGVAFLGVPLVMIGFNAHVAWSNTVSTARRFGLFDLALAEGRPTDCLVDGAAQPLQSREVAVTLKGEGGQARTLSRRLYRSAQGPIVDLGAQNPAFGWSATHALAIRDANAENFRVFRTFWAWNQAGSLDEFIAIQRRELALPWVNTTAVDRSGRAWFADFGPVPNVPDALRERCTTPLAQGFAQLDAFTPFLDGSRADCDWQADAAAVQPGTLPARSLPSLLRSDQVANMNDSYWLANPAQPLRGFARVLGGEQQALSLRARQGHAMARRLAAMRPGSARALAAELREVALGAQAESALRFKAGLLHHACAQPKVNLPATEASPAAQVDVTAACAVLASWSGRADGQGHGGLLWELFWAQWLQAVPAEARFEMPFSAAAPLDTPRGPRAEGAAQALATAVQAMAAQGTALSATTTSQRLVQTGAGPLPVYGGCDGVGYFATACNDDGSDPLGPNTSANSYLQVVSFGPRGLQAHTLLAHGQDEQAVSGGAGLAGAAPVQRYVRRDWLAFPFTEAEISRDPALTSIVLSP
ncbi:penicillin acylase family protein [Ideonella azotifigens]|uniref:Penicillin acylase family protein n=2 Tax=Ideonella azotifigens TaxID=513160 RepID=A0ABN1K3V2_9BURK|nr:penicillin acylase family protein [Ideonella azotifigens]MCD2344902.1 penicillin acylase family protein [Ideonella azotifigens]